MRLYHALNKTFITQKEVSKQTKLKVFKTVYRPVLTFGCKAWTLTNQIKSKIQANEMKFLRVTREHRIGNIDIREELGIESILDYIKKRQKSWFGHLQRLPKETPVRGI